jgi:hypothetical protein
VYAVVQAYTGAFDGIERAVELSAASFTSHILKTRSMAAARPEVPTTPMVINKLVVIRRPVVLWAHRFA